MKMGKTVISLSKDEAKLPLPPCREGRCKWIRHWNLENEFQHQKMLCEGELIMLNIGFSLLKAKLNKTGKYIMNTLFYSGNAYSY